MKKRYYLLVCLLILNFLTASSQVDTGQIQEMSSKNSLDLEIAKSYVANYRNKWKKHKRFPIFGKKYDARACWFDLKKLETFIAEAKKYAQKHYKVDISGVRFYYMAYPRKDDEVPHDATYYRKTHSLIMVATVECVTDNNEIYHQDLIDAKTKRLVAFNVTDKDIIENNGTLCPPLPKPSCTNGLILLDLANGTKTDIPAYNINKK